MKVVIEVELTDKEAKMVSINSLERVINMSMQLATRSKHPDSFTNEDDWKELKSVVMRLWHGLTNAIFIHGEKKP